MAPQLSLNEEEVFLPLLIVSRVLNDRGLTLRVGGDTKESLVRLEMTPQKVVELKLAEGKWKKLLSLLKNDTTSHSSPDVRV